MVCQANNNYLFKNGGVKANKDAFMHYLIKGKTTAVNVEPHNVDLFRVTDKPYPESGRQVHELFRMQLGCCSDSGTGKLHFFSCAPKLHWLGLFAACAR